MESLSLKTYAYNMARICNKLGDLAEKQGAYFVDNWPHILKIKPTEITLRGFPDIKETIRFNKYIHFVLNKIEYYWQWDDNMFFGNSYSKAKLLEYSPSFPNGYIGKRVSCYLDKDNQSWMDDTIVIKCLSDTEIEIYATRLLVYLFTASYSKTYKTSNNNLLKIMEEETING